MKFNSGCDITELILFRCFLGFKQKKRLWMPERYMVVEEDRC